VTVVMKTIMGTFKFSKMHLVYRIAERQWGIEERLYCMDLVLVFNKLHGAESFLRA
jgi:hypothetical protein